MEIICRDRAGAYAEGARRGAPDALRVADRFHLWQGLGRAVQTCVAAHYDCLRDPSPSSILPEATRLTSGRPQDDPAPIGRRVERKEAAHASVHELLAQGHSRRAIAQHLSWGLNTVLRYANAARRQDTIRGNRPDPAGWTPTSPTWNDASPRDAPASPTSAVNSSPTTRPSPTRWSAATSPPCVGLRLGRRPSLRRCAR
ncbi:hypothetical protein ABT084_21235 [Streptomyces sp. NPDC002138]|uniref:hypothetical protein n=1 Tax=Streptomyces sp. NPDC002138 TaxID=3154410 RepID=UPI003333A684